MKKLLLGVIIFIPFIFVSCDKTSGGASGGGTIEPPPATKPVITASDPSKGWYDSTLAGTFYVSSTESVSVAVSAVITATGAPVVVNVSGSSYSIKNVTQQVTINIVATNKNGSDSKSVYGNVYDSNTSLLCKDLRVFDPIYLRIGNGFPQTSGLVGSYQLNTDGTGRYIQGNSSGNAHWYFTTVGGIYLNGPIWQTFQFLDSKTFEVTGTDGIGGPITVMRYKTLL